MIAAFPLNPVPTNRTPAYHRNHCPHRRRILNRRRPPRIRRYHRQIRRHSRCDAPPPAAVHRQRIRRRWHTDAAAYCQLRDRPGYRRPGVRFRHRRIGTESHRHARCRQRARRVQMRQQIRRPRVILLGRLSLYGRRAERLHEVLTPVAARWIEPSRRRGPLRAYADEAEARTLERLEAALRDARVPGPTIHRRLREGAASDVEDLQPQLEARAAAVAESAKEGLRRRGEAEARQLRETLERQRRRVAAELARHEAEEAQLTIDFSADEKRQRQADLTAWRRRLTQFDRDLESEPARIRRFYEVAARRVEPIGLVYLWPDTG